MAFVKREIKDRVVQYPRRYQLVEVQPGIFDLIPVTGTVTEEGTPVNKELLQRYEDGISDLDAEVVAHKADNVQQFANVEYNIYQLFLQNYYDSKYPLKRGLFFDGFADDNVIDINNSDVVLDTNNKIIKTPTPTEIIQDQETTTEFLGYGTGAFTEKFGQTFTIPSGVSNINSAKVITKLGKNGSPSDGVTCKLFSVSGGLPNALLATSSTIIDGNEITTVQQEYEFVFEGINLVAGTMYAITFERTGTLNSTNYYILSSTGNKYPSGTLIRTDNGTWGTQATADLYFKISSSVDVISKYQSKVQTFSQNVSNAVLYVKSKTTSGCSISCEIAICTDTETFTSMVLENTRYLDGGYQEDKFVYNGTLGDKVKVRLTLNRPDVSTEFEVNEYGCILGVS